MNQRLNAAAVDTSPRSIKRKGGVQNFQFQTEYRGKHVPIFWVITHGEEDLPLITRTNSSPYQSKSPVILVAMSLYVFS